MFPLCLHFGWEKRIFPVALLSTGFLFGTSLLGRKMCRFPTLKCLGGIFGALLKLDHVEIIQLLFPAEYISLHSLQSLTSLLPSTEKNISKNPFFAPQQLQTIKNAPLQIESCIADRFSCTRNCHNQYSTDDISMQVQIRRDGFPGDNRQPRFFGFLRCGFPQSGSGQRYRGLEQQRVKFHILFALTNLIPAARPCPAAGVRALMRAKNLL